MAIQTYEVITLPVLKFLREGKERTLRELDENIYIYFELSNEEKPQIQN